jgi:membrane protein required for colicin V production
MNWLDVVIVLVIAFFAVTAFRAGLIREVVTLFSVIVGVVVASIFYDDLAGDVLFFIDDEKTARLVSFLILLGAIYLVGQLVAIMLKQVAAVLFLGWADRIGGGLFGLLKGLIIVEVLLIVFVTFPRLGLDGAIDGSAIASVFLDARSAVLFVLPDEFEREVDAFVA